MIIPSLEIDKDGYPDEGIIEEIRALPFEHARQFLREDFPLLAKELPCSSIRVKEVQDDDSLHGKELEIIFTTGGWSGCEDFISAVLGNFLLRVYYWQWNRGGRHVFRVPLEDK